MPYAVNRGPESRHTAKSAFVCALKLLEWEQRSSALTDCFYNIARMPLSPARSNGKTTRGNCAVYFSSTRGAMPRLDQGWEMSGYVPFNVPTLSSSAVP